MTFVGESDAGVPNVQVAQRESPSTWIRTHRRGATVQGRLRAFVLVGVLLVVVVATAGLVAVNYSRDRTDQVTEFDGAHDRLDEIDRAAENLRNNVDQAIFVSEGVVKSTQAEAQRMFVVQVGVMGDSLTAAQAVHLPASVHQLIQALRGPVPAFITQADNLVGLAFTDLPAAKAALPAFDQIAAELDTKLQTAIDAIDVLTNRARQSSDEVPGQIAAVLIGMLVVTVLVLGLCAFVLGRSLRRSLRALGDVARSIARGELHTRATITSRDELGELGNAINDMATDLQVLVRQMEATAEREGFGSQLSEALEMADTEADALRIIERAMTSISSTSPMEILLADSSKAHLERAASNPAIEPPCCPVESPFGCVAVRRGNPVVFESSEALNACPKLRGRASGPISAMCVPVTFMGRALGVLHATGPVGVAFDAEAMSQLTSLATQSGARIGTVRSFERSQLQAMTDGLTGLRNRRTVETELRTLLNEGTQLTLAMADLDHFKLLNDTYGHDAGDRALRRFSQVLGVSLRESDIAGRYGGEEFVIALPGTPVSTAVEILDRLRERLVAAGEESGSPTFTASFGVVDSSLGGSLEELLRIADAALYRAKDEGRNRVAIADGRDAEAVARAGESSVLVSSPRSQPTVGAFQRAASFDDPMG
jgi:diguanylate cyclase (GGDEF)-like protein